MNKDHLEAVFYHAVTLHVDLVRHICSFLSWILKNSFQTTSLGVKILKMTNFLCSFKLSQCKVW